VYRTSKGRVMRATGRTRWGGRGSAHLIRALVGFIGFMLSPLSPWNDAFVNVPLSIAIAKAVSGVVDFRVAYVVAYALTNVIGIAMMVMAGKGLSLNRKDLLQTLLIGLVGYLILLLVSA